MLIKRIAFTKSYKFAIGGLMLIALLTVGSIPFFSRARLKDETIEATAMGTSTQLGQIVGVTLIIYDYSTPEDRVALVEAFTKGQNQGTRQHPLQNESRRPLLHYRHSGL